MKIDDTQIPTYSEIAIENLDFILRGNINSLSNLLALFIGDADAIQSAITADGRIQISGKIRSITDNDLFGYEEMEEYVSVVSFFVDLGISGSLPQAGTPSGFLSGNVQFSIGSNLRDVYTKTAEAGHWQLLHSPVTLQLDLAPFTNVDIHELQQLGQDERDIDSNPFSELKALMWPDATGPIFTITRTIGNYDATQVRETTTWTDEEAFALLPQLVGGRT